MLEDYCRELSTLLHFTVSIDENRKMHARYLLLCFMLQSFIISAQCYAEEVYDFQSLAQKTLLNNDTIIESKTSVSQNEIFYKSNYRLNIPELTVGAEHSSSSLEQTSTPAFDTDLQVQKYSLGLSGELPRPGIEYSFLVGKNDQTQKDYLLSPEITKDGNEFSAEVSLQLLEKAGYLVGNVAFDESKFAYKLSQANYNLTEQKTLLLLIERYLNVCVLQEKLAITKKILAQAQKLYESYQQLYREGRISKVDFLSASIQLNEQKSSLIDLSVVHRESKRELFTLVGGFDRSTIESDVALTPLAKNWLDSSIYNTDAGPQSDGVYLRNPEINLIEQQRKVSQLKIQALENRVLPSLKLAGGMTKTSNPILNVLDTDLTTNERYFIGLNLSLPLNNIAAKADLSAQKVEKSNLDTRSNLLKRSMDLKLRGIKSEIAEMEEKIKILKDTEILSQKRYEAAVPLVKVSASARIDIFTFQNQLVQTQFDISDLQARLISKKSQLLFESGDLAKAALR